MTTLANKVEQTCRTVLLITMLDNDFEDQARALEDLQQIFVDWDEAFRADLDHDPNAEERLPLETPLGEHTQPVYERLVAWEQQVRGILGSQEDG